MTHLSWDEIRPCMLRRWRYPGGRESGHAAAASGWMENTRMNIISTLRAAMVALIPMVAIALGSAALAQSPAPSASPAASPCGIAGDPGTGRIPRPPPPRRRSPPCRRRPRPKSPADPPAAAQTPLAAPARRQRPDRRSLRRRDHAGAEEGGDHQGHRQLGYRVRHPDRFVQGADRAARQAGHQGVRQSDDRLHLDRRQRLHLPRRDSGRPGAEEPAPRT